MQALSLDFPQSVNLLSMDLLGKLKHMLHKLDLQKGRAMQNLYGLLLPLSPVHSGNSQTPSVLFKGITGKPVTQEVQITTKGFF